MKNKSNAELDNSAKLRFELSRKISKASERLQDSCNWACSLAEGIDQFPDTVCDVVKQLETLRKRMKHSVRSDGTDLQRITSALRKLNGYSALMKSTKHPLSVIGIIEDAGQLEEFKDLLSEIIDRQ
jgi:hypothetical protein